MKTPLKTALMPAALFAAIVPLTAVQAGQGDDGIVVTSQAEMDTWQKETTRDLNRNLKFSPVARNASTGAGIVQIAFRLDANGKPTDLALEDSSANWVAERSAMYAVRRLGDLSDVPVIAPDGTRFLANIVFATSENEHAELSAKLEQSERARLASGSVRSTYVALGG